jgi:hypothetical protein
MVIMMEMRSKIKIGGKEYSIGTLKVLTGEEIIKPRSVKKDFLLLAEAIDDPDSFPFLLKDIYNISNNNEDLRLGLARVQIDSKFKMKEDLESYNTRLFISETIEKMLFGGLLVEGDGKKDEDNEKGSAAKKKGGGRKKK